MLDNKPVPPTPDSSAATLESSDQDVAALISNVHALSEAGRYGEALSLASAELSRRPGDCELQFLRASVLFDWGRIHEARAGFVRAEAHGLARNALHLNLAWSCHLLHLPDEAEHYARKAIALDSSEVAAHFLLGTVLQRQKRYPEAIASYERSLELSPEYANGAAGVAHCKLELNEYTGAEDWMRRAVALAPDNPQFWINLGAAIAKQERYAEALIAFERAGELELALGVPRESSSDRGTALILMGQAEAAAELFRSDLPELLNPNAHTQYAHALLTLGQLREGWEHYEFRWMQEPHLTDRPRFLQPPWIGQNLAGKTILIRAEQGAGDIIQFARFAIPLAAMGATVVLQVRPEIVQLAKGFAGIDQVFAPPTLPPHYDYYVHLMGIPRVLGTELATIPSKVPYLRVDPTRVEQWKGRIEGRGLKVGLAWAGNPLHKRDHYRSVPFDRLGSLWDIPGVRYFSLQKQPLASDIEKFPPASVMLDLGPNLEDFSDTAAAIAQLDLVICVDTSIAHLAGALGKPVWLLLPEIGDFRWLLAREDSPWYPTMRFFRQGRLGEWDEVLDRVKTALEETVRASSFAVTSLERRDSEEIAQPARGSARPMLADRRARSPAGLARVAETRYGIFQYVPHSDDATRSLESYGEYLQSQVELLARIVRPGAQVIEVGSGVGAHAIPLAKMVGAEGHLFLYEPRAIPRRLLRGNLDANQASRSVTLMRGKLGTGGPAEQSETVDDLLLDRLDLIKLHEHVSACPILEGASATLWRLRPLLFVAVPDASSLTAAAELAMTFGYRCWRMDTSIFDSGNFYRVEDDVSSGRSSIALLAVPEETSPAFVPDGCEEIPGATACTVNADEPDNGPQRAGFMQSLRNFLTPGRSTRPEGARGARSVAKKVPRALAPDVAHANALLGWGRVREATVELLRLAANSALETRDRGPLGIALLAVGRTTEAEPWLRKAEAHGDLEAQVGLVQCLQRAGRGAEALSLCDSILRERFDDQRILYLQSQCYAMLGRQEARAVCLRRVLDLDPRNEMAWFNLGAAQRALGHHDEALLAFVEAHRNRSPLASFDTMTDLALAYQATGQLDRGIRVIEESLPDNPTVEGHRMYAQLLLAAGRLVEGWSFYEFRWMLEPLLSTRGRMSIPAWNGQGLAGKTILLRVEQGLGDVIQFMRYASILKGLGARVVVGNFSELASYFHGVERVLTADVERAQPDFYANLLSLPRVFGTDSTSIPAPIPYLSTDAEKVASWKQRLATATGLRVGLVWAGGPKHPADKQRSMGLQQMSPLLDVAGVTFFALQKGTPAGQVDTLGLASKIQPLDGQLDDFCDTAAAISQLDLVICVDTSVGHLAGALGKPVWMLLAHPADWRWMELREDTPWYPAMRLFRQTKANDWQDVIQRVRSALQERVAAPQAGTGPVLSTLPSVPVPRSAEELLTDSRPGFASVTETADGILQFLPDEPIEGASLACYGEFLRGQLEQLGSMLRPGMFVLEVDAGVGAHALFLSERLGADGNLFLIESNPTRRQILRQNILVNRVENATVLQGPLVDSTEDLEGTLPAWASIDDLQLERLDWIKFQTERTAKAVVDDARDTLWRLRPKVFVGVRDNASAVAMAEILREFGYRCWRIEMALFNSANFARYDRDIFAGLTATGLFAFPEEFDEEFALAGGVEIT